jgi:hypothetical protein
LHAEHADRSGGALDEYYVALADLGELDQAQRGTSRAEERDGLRIAERVGKLI